MNCRSGCGACCIAPSISSSIPGMPQGKRAGERCLHLTPDHQCAIFHDPRRPAVCGSLMARRDMCGENREFALHYLADLELQTAPAR